jgi:hypothetical protein
MSKAIKLAATVMVSTMLATPATATAPLRFVLQGDLNASWTLPASPSPLLTASTFFTLTNVNVTSGGSTGARLMSFYTEDDLGGMGFGVPGMSLFNANGPQLFTGATTTPTFRTGIFTLQRFSLDTPGNGTLTISNVPEPANWAMLIAGFGLTGLMMRRRSRTIAAA